MADVDCFAGVDMSLTVVIKLRLRVEDEGPLQQDIHNDELEITLLNRLLDLLAHSFGAECDHHEDHDDDAQDDIADRDHEEQPIVELRPIGVTCKR